MFLVLTFEIIEEDVLWDSCDLESEKDCGNSSLQCIQDLYVDRPLYIPSDVRDVQDSFKDTLETLVRAYDSTEALVDHKRCMK